MKQYKEECKIVMRKLARIASVVVNVGKSCERYNLNEGEIPDGLRTILGSLQRFVYYMVALSRNLMNDKRAG